MLFVGVYGAGSAFHRLFGPRCTLHRAPGSLVCCPTTRIAFTIHMSTAIVKVTPISGCRQEHEPSCYLLEIDQAKILLDVGGTATFSTDHLRALRRITKTLDMVLLSHGDLEHCGGLPQLLSMLETSCPVLATVPVHHLGLVTLYDAYQSHYQATGRPPPVTLDEVDAAFERITILRYSQSFTSPLSGIQVTPVASGHTLGGAIWRIRRHSEEIFYAVDFNHKKEAHLDGAALEGVQRPSLLIADTKGALDVHPARKQRDGELADSMMNALKGGGSILLPVDSAGRVLEVLQVIETYWITHKVAYPVFFLSHQSQRVVDLAKGMLEWMSTTLTKVFEQDRTNPFDLRAIRIVHSMEDVASVKGPKVVLSGLASLESGFALTMLPEMLAHPASAIIFTTKSAAESISATVLSAVKGTSMTVEYSEEVPLEGTELQEYREEERMATERRAAEEAFAQLQREREDESEDEDQSDGEDVTREGGGSKKRLEEEQINSAAALQNVYWTDYRNDWYVNVDALPLMIDSPFYPLIPPDQAITPNGIPLRYQVFPHREVRYVADGYGELVDPNEFKSNTTTSTPFLDSQVPAAVPNLIQAIAPLVEPERKQPTIPMKWITRNHTVPVKCTRKFIDYSGISDGRSLKTIYTRIQPKRLLLVGGSTEATEYLYNHFQQTIPARSMEVFAPHLLETVTVSTAVNVKQAILSESLISRLQLQLQGEYELGWVRGVVRIPEEGEVIDELSAKRRMIVLTAAPSAPSPILLGDPRLSELRRVIQGQLGVAAAFDQGDLVCGQGERRVIIRKDPTTAALTLEGPLCAEYYSVRRLLYSFTAFLQ